MEPVRWYVGEDETDPGEWCFDGTVWEEPSQEEMALMDQSGGEISAEPYLVADGIRHRAHADLIAAAPALWAALDRVVSEASAGRVGEDTLGAARAVLRMAAGGK